MKNAADTIWAIPAFLPYLQPKLTDEAIASAEKKLGYKLPEEFLSLLRRQNGGYIRLSLPDLPHTLIAGIGPNFPSLTEFDWRESQEYVSYPLEGLVPFDGDGHWHLCLDYRKNHHTPSVTYIDIECDEQTVVSASFDEYLTLLRLKCHSQYIIEREPDVEVIKSRLSTELGISFDAPNSYTYGYVMHRARVGGPSSREWIWISPNAVPCGFVRPDDRRYEELKDLMAGVALRYSEVASESFILQTTDSVRDEVLDACISAKIAIRPLRDVVSVARESL